MPSGYEPPEGISIDITAPGVIRWDTRALRITRAIRMAGEATGSGTTSGSLVAKAVSPFSLGVTALASVGTNLYDYGLGEHKNEGIWSRGFWVSTAVDFVVPIAIGILTAAAVWLVAGAAVAAGAATATVGPVAIVAAAVVAVAASIVVEITGASSDIKDAVGKFIDDREEEWERRQDVPVQRVAPKGPPYSLP